MNWIDINKAQPEWYTNVELMVDGKVEQHWHRLCGDNDNVYYGSLETNRIIPEEDVTHWKPLKYKPKEDIKEWVY